MYSNMHLVARPPWRKMGHVTVAIDECPAAPSE